MGCGGGEPTSPSPGFESIPQIAGKNYRSDAPRIRTAIRILAKRLFNLVEPDGSYGRSGNLDINSDVKTADYAAEPDELVQVDSSSANIDITLPTTPAHNTRFAVWHRAGAGHTLTIKPGGSDQIEDGGQVTVSLDDSEMWQYDSGRANWVPIARI